MLDVSILGIENKSTPEIALGVSFQVEASHDSKVVGPSPQCTMEIRVTFVVGIDDAPIC